MTPNDKPLHLFDARMVDRHIARGLVTKEEYAAWLASLPDEAEEGTELVTQFVHTTHEDDGVRFDDPED